MSEVENRLKTLPKCGMSHRLHPAPDTGWSCLAPSLLGCRAPADHCSRQSLCGEWGVCSGEETRAEHSMVQLQVPLNMLEHIWAAGKSTRTWQDRQVSWPSTKSCFQTGQSQASEAAFKSVQGKPADRCAGLNRQQVPPGRMHSTKGAAAFLSSLRTAMVCSQAPEAVYSVSSPPQGIGDDGNENKRKLIFLLI